MTQQEQKQKLDEIAERMKTAKGAELDELTAEVDRIIGFDTGDEEYDPERVAQWELANGKKP